MSKILSFIFASIFLLAQASLQAADVNVAVAANFTAPMQKIAQAFEQNTGHKVILSSGATGALYAQIQHGAPFHIFLSADSTTPEKLEKENIGVAGTRFTYATGKLVLWSKQPALVDSDGKVLQTSTFDRIAIANPTLAPYGAATIETLKKMHLLSVVQEKIVQGDNIAQTYQFIATGNAALGFVALSQVIHDGKITEGSAWIVPEQFHAHIKQEAILLNAGKDNPTATALLAFLRSEKAREIIRSYGYAL